MGTYTVKLAATVFVLTALNSEAAVPPAAQLSSSGALERAVDDYLSSYVESHNFSGSVLIARHGEVLLRKGYGMANYELSVPNRPETRFHIASVTKSFTAAAILLLRDEGRLSLDNTVSRFFPDFPNADRIIVEQLLAHTSGLPRLVFFPDYGEQSRIPHTIDALIAWIAAKEPASEPGDSYRYSNANYVLLAGIIEKASGQSYREFLVTHILQPLGMSDTGHNGRAEELIANRASGYVTAGIDALENAAYHDYSFDAGAGSLYSTVDDLYRWVLSARESKSGLERPADNEAGSFGYRWLSGERLGRPVLQRTGWDGVGFAAQLVHYINERLTIIVLSNLNISGITADIANQLTLIALGEPHEPFALKSEPLDPAFARAVTGVYRFGDDFYVPGAEMRIVEKDGALFEDQASTGRLTAFLPVGEREFIHRPHWSRVVFEDNEEGTVTAMRYGDFQAEKIPEEKKEPRIDAHERKY